MIRSTKGLVLSFDHGPLGVPPLYNHGHADALSITLSLNGIPILIDPGTYRYNNEPEFRRYFKGTRAHNTVSVDGEDQAVQETSFIWSCPYRAALAGVKQVDSARIFEAVHDGYSRLKSPVKHRRSLLLSAGGIILVRDFFEGVGAHQFESNYHFHPDAVVTNGDGWWRAERGETGLFIRLMDGEDFNRHQGQVAPPFGWYSPAYGIRRPNAVLSATRVGRAEHVSFTTAICTEAPMDIGSLREKTAHL